MLFLRRIVAVAALSTASFCHVASAQAARPVASVLSVSLPPNARLRLDVDARDGDLLGVVKSFFNGANGATLKQILPQLRAKDGDATKTAPSSETEKLAALQFLSDADLSTMLKDITHLRVVVFETPYRYGVRRSAKAQQATIAHYEAAYLTREGERRIVRGDFDDTQLLTVGFPNGGWGVVMQAPGLGIVVRADGYPDLKGVSPVAMALLVKLAGQMR